MKNLKDILRFNKWLIVLGIIVLGYVFFSTNYLNNNSKYIGDENRITGKVLSLSLNGNKLSMKIKGKETIIVNYFLKQEQEIKVVLDNISLGDTLIFNGTMIKPQNNTIPNTFNYKDYLRKKGIFYTFKANSYEKISSNNFLYNIKDFLLKRAYNNENSDYYLAFLLGDKTLLNSDDYSNYQKNGISHLLAISGMHISVILSLISLLLKRFKEKTKFIIIIISLIFFSFITDFSASVMRANIFYIFITFNQTFGLRYSNVQILILTGLIILIINPFIIYDFGFIYSFIVCFGIIYYSDGKTKNYFLDLLKISIISFLFSLPVTAMLNYEINLMSIFLNLVFVPLISLIVYPISLISFIFPIFSGIFTISIKFTAFLNALLSNFSLMITIPKLSIIFMIIFYLILIIFKNKPKYLLILIVLIGIVKVIPKLDNNYHVYFLDVGQGDCSVLISPKQKEVIMIDTGGKVSFDNIDWKKGSKNYKLSDKVIKFLHSIGINKIDYLILSHGDYDHAGEAINILKNTNVKKIVLNNGDLNNLEKSIKDFGIVSKDYDLQFFYIKNLNNKDYNNENENSIINSIKFLKYHLLFMGDASIKQEKYILEKYNLSNVDILKAGHHGSKTSNSKEFIKNINPKFAVISVGKNNKFGHPDKDVINNLKNSSIYRTDQDGTIWFKFNKNNFAVYTYNP